MTTLYWAKVKPEAKIPTKRKEDAGYDLYPCFEQDYIEIQPHHTVLVPLGVASAFPSDYVMLLKERGSTGTKGMAQRAGVIDSGYRGEYIAPVTNVNDVPLFISKIDIETEGIVYPYEKALCQGVLVALGQLEEKTVSLDELNAMESLRQTGRLGSSGK